MFSVYQDSFPIITQERDRVGHHVERFGGGRAQRFGDVPGRRLRDQADVAGTGPDQVSHDGIRFGPSARFSSSAECHQFGVRQDKFSALRSSEKLAVFRVGARPATLYVLDAQQVELLGYPELVVNGERKALCLAPVAKGGIENLNSAG